MLQRGLTLAAILLMTGLSLAAEKVTLEQLPEPARKTVLEQTKGGTIQQIEKETKDGKDVFEVEFRREDKKWELKVAPDGKLIELKEDD